MFIINSRFECLQRWCEPLIIDPKLKANKQTNKQKKKENSHTASIFGKAIFRLQ